MLKLYKNIIDKNLKYQIAMQYNIPSSKAFENYFRAIVELRNLCAHGRALFDHKLATPLINSRILTITNSNKNKMAPAIEIIETVLERISQERATEFKMQTTEILSEYCKIPVVGTTIKESLGYNS